MILTFKVTRTLVGFVGLAVLAGCSPEPVNEGVVEELLDGPRMILVTGATGRQGGAVAKELLSRGYQVRAMTRDASSDRAQALVKAGAEVIQGDFADPDSLLLATFGVYGVFSVQPAGQDEAAFGKAIADAAKGQGVSHLVYSSSAAADPNSVHVPSPKLEIDKHIRELQLPYTIFRPVSFFENWAGRYEEVANAGVRDARPASSVSQHISVQDIAFFVAEAFDDPESWLGRSLNIASESLSQEDLAKTFGQVMNREVAYEQITWEEYAEVLPPRLIELYRFLEAHDGYPVNVEELRSQYPNLMTLEAYLEETGWAEWQPAPNEQIEVSPSDS